MSPLYPWHTIMPYITILFHRNYLYIEKKSKTESTARIAFSLKFNMSIT